MSSRGATEAMAEVGAEVGLARAAVAAVAVVAVAAEVAVEKVKVEVEKVAEAAGAPGAGRSRRSRCPACMVEARAASGTQHRRYNLHNFDHSTFLAQPKN